MLCPQNLTSCFFFQSVKTSHLVFSECDFSFLRFYILEVATLSNIRQLANVSPEIQECFENISEANNEMRVSFYNEKGQTTLSVSSSETSLQGKNVKIIVINDISNEMSRNEEMSWNKLIRVLTHEIMNTVTPIASLSHTLSMDITSAESKPVNKEELKLGLNTISESARGLIKFVDTYRSLTRISAPVKKAFYLKELIERVTQRNLMIFFCMQTKTKYLKYWST